MGSRGVAAGKEGSPARLVIGVGAPGTGVEQGQDQRLMFVGSRGGKRPSDGEDLSGCPGASSAERAAIPTPVLTNEEPQGSPGNSRSIWPAEIWRPSVGGTTTDGSRGRHETRCETTPEQEVLS
jgi:hypothetical protein